MVAMELWSKQCVGFGATHMNFIRLLIKLNQGYMAKCGIGHGKRLQRHRSVSQEMSRTFYDREKQKEKKQKGESKNIDQNYGFFPQPSPAKPEIVFKTDVKKIPKQIKGRHKQSQAKHKQPQLDLKMALPVLPPARGMFPVG